MSKNSFDYLKDAFSSPLGDFIASIGEGVGEAQAALDEGSLRQTLGIYNTDPDNADASLKLLREIGYQPTFYTLPKTTAKAKISLSISQQNNSTMQNGKAFRTKMYAAPVNASNVNKYNLDINASAELTFDIVPVPPSDNQVIRFLPNVVFKTIKDENDNEEEVKRSFGEIKTLLMEYNLEYNFSENINAEKVTDETEFSDQFPKFDKNKPQILRANDVITLIK